MDGARRAPALDNAALRHAAKVTPRSILPAALDLATRPTALSHGSRCGVGRAMSSRRWDSSGWVFLCSCSRPPPPRFSPPHVGYSFFYLSRVRAWSCAPFPKTIASRPRHGRAPKNVFHNDFFPPPVVISAPKAAPLDFRTPTRRESAISTEGRPTLRHEPPREECMTQTQTMVELLSQVQDAATVLQRQQRLRVARRAAGRRSPRNLMLPLRLRQRAGRRRRRRSRRRSSMVARITSLAPPPRRPPRPRRPLSLPSTCQWMPTTQLRAGAPMVPCRRRRRRRRTHRRPRR